MAYRSLAFERATKKVVLTIIYILLVLLLVAANGFFVASEFALVGVRRSRITTLAAAGNRRAKLLLELLDNLNAYISATQLGITMASLALGWIGEPVFAHLLEGPLAGRVSQSVLDTISFAIAFTVITFLHIVVGELAPKTLALERAESMALAIAWPMKIFHQIFRWPIRALDWSGVWTVRLFGLHPSGEHASIYTEDELRHLIDASRASGHVEPQQQRLINRVFDFADAEVREAMVPRVNVAGLPVTAGLAEVEEAFRTLRYSRLPVYRERLDEVVGVLFFKDVAALDDRQRADFDLQKLLHPPFFIPATAHLGNALTQMQTARTHLAFVIDEHGGLEGIVTLEDLLEEIVGEINDEFDEEVRAQIIKDNGSYLLDGMLAVRNLNRRFSLHVPEQAGYTTLAGFLMAQTGQVPEQGEVVDYDGARFIIEHVKGRTIRRVRFTPATSETHTPNKASIARVLPSIWLSIAVLCY
jgi:CBS domain containing-hemolysin-like protein